MALIDTTPADLASTNELDKFADDLLEIPPAYLVFGTSPAAMIDPPKYGEKVTYVIRARVTAEHGPIERKDGERRYTRTMAVQAIWKQGDPEPPDAEDEVPPPALYDDEMEPSDEATGETGE